MTQQRLNQENGALDLNSIAKEFTQANERQIAFFRPKIFLDHIKFYFALFIYLVSVCQSRKEQI